MIYARPVNRAGGQMVTQGLRMKPGTARSSSGAVLSDRSNKIYGSPRIVGVKSTGCSKSCLNITWQRT